MEGSQVTPEVHQVEDNIYSDSNSLSGMKPTIAPVIKSSLISTSANIQPAPQTVAASPLSLEGLSSAV